VSSPVRDRFAAAVREQPVDLGLACLLLAAEFDADLAAPGALQPWLDVLDELAGRVPPDGPAVDRLRAALGGFAGHGADDYADLRSSLLHEVLRRRRGLPILLSVVWLEVARRVGIPAYGVGLPGHFVVAIGQPDGYSVLVDPYAGGRRWRQRGPGGRGGPAGGDARHERPWEPVEILARILANIRHWADRPDRLPVRLAAVELALRLPRHAVALRRESGQLRVGLGDFLGGAAELDAYADAVEPVDAEGAEEARRAARHARARLN
jgi:regulator of sirC expression with transglutaminase-like and TPR domain